MTSILTPPTSRSTRAQGCLAGLALGNVLGLSVESRSREEAMRPHLIHMAGQTNPHPTESKPWFHTIDLQQLVRSVGSQCGLPGLSTAVLTRTAIYGVRKA